MSIHFLVGKPGGGKTLSAMRLLCNELRTTSRHVVTNISLDVPEIVRFMEMNYGRDFNCAGRITCLDDLDVMRKYWEVRGPDSSEFRIGRQGFEGNPGKGVFYLLDEVHVLYPSRDFSQNQKTGIIFYNSQHRHLGDDVIYISQNAEQVDKQVRGLAQDYTHIRNFGKEKYLGMRLPFFFHYRVFLRPPGNDEVCMTSGSFRLNSEFAKWYNTRAGVGVSGLGDEMDSRGGFNWKWIFVGAAVVIILLSFVPSVGQAFGRFVVKKTSISPPIVVGPSVASVPLVSSVLTVLPALSVVPSVESVAVGVVPIVICGRTVVDGIEVFYGTDGECYPGRRVGRKIILDCLQECRWETRMEMELRIAGGRPILPDSSVARASGLGASVVGSPGPPPSHPGIPSKILF